MKVNVTEWQLTCRVETSVRAFAEA